jgi:hypothetical protein
MDPVATIEFRDSSTQDGGVIIVQRGKGVVALAVSLQTDGDVEVLLAADDCRRVVEALEQALRPS